MSGILSNDDWISRLPPALAEVVTARMRVKCVPMGQEFSRPGEIPSGIFRVRSGYLRLIAPQPDGSQVLITLYGPGACFAETALIAQRALKHATVALLDAEVEILPAAEFWALYEENREIADALVLKFSKVIGTQISHHEEKATRRTARRIADVFEELGRVCGKLQLDGAIEIALPLTQIDLAEHLSLARQTVHRELGVLRAQGLISKSGMGWLINNPIDLKNFN